MMSPPGGGKMDFMTLYGPEPFRVSAILLPASFLSRTFHGGLGGIENEAFLTNADLHQGCGGNL